MNTKCYGAIITTLFLLCLTTSGDCAVDWQSAITLQTGGPTLDTAITADGKWTFVLSEGGLVHIYDKDGTLDDTIPVAPEMDRIAVSGAGEKLLLGSSHNNTVQQLNLSFIADINTDGAPSLGNPQAPVKVVVFSDFECPYCAKVGILLEYVLEHNPETVQVIYKQFPLSFHKNAQKAAIASLAAQNQGKFWTMHDLLFQNSKELTGEKIEALAKEAGLDMERFNKDLTNTDLIEQVGQDITDGRLAGVRGTPTIFVNGRILHERSPEGLQALIDRELARIQKASVK